MCLNSSLPHMGFLWMISLELIIELFHGLDLKPCFETEFLQSL